MEKGPKSVEDPGLIRKRLLVLMGLCLQTAGFALMTRYSRTILHEEYSSAEVVILAETVKTVVSGVISVRDSTETDAQGRGLSKLWWLLLNSKKIIVLVVLYSLANILSYYALARVDASVYTVMCQLKSLTTAGMAVLILGRNISLTKWRALFLLVLGCVLVASPTYNNSTSTDGCDVETGVDSAENKHDELAIDGSAVDSYGQGVLGVGAVLVMVVLSGFSSVYFESVLKNQGEKVTIWERNFQLAFYSVVLVVGIRAYEITTSIIDGDFTADSFTLFKGWTFLTVLLGLTMASGGLLVAATLKYADAIMKTLSTAGSIVLATLMGAMLLGDTLDIFVCIGCMCTILAIVNYSFE